MRNPDSDDGARGSSRAEEREGLVDGKKGMLDLSGRLGGVRTVVWAWVGVLRLERWQWWLQ